MGPRHLILLLLVACGGASNASPADAPAPKGPHHVQVIHAARTETRQALGERLRKRSGEAWVVKPEEVDGVRLVIRHAVRTDPPGKAAQEPTDEDASRAATAFVTTNADVLGIGTDDALRLDAEPFPVDLARHAKAVRFSGTLPMRGFESFESLQSVFEIVIFVDADGVVRELKNLSRVHPRLTLDTHPLLGPNDPALLQNVVGRELFAVYADPSRPNRDVRALKRDRVGKAEPTDVIARTLTIQASPGPFDAFLSYHLAYAIDVGRGGYWFRFIVDADTGALLDDAAPPLVNAPAP